MLSKTNGCQPVCFIGLSTSMFYRSTLQPALLISRNYTHYVLSPNLTAGLSYVTWHFFSTVGEFLASDLITLQNIFVLNKIFCWMAGKMLYAMNNEETVKARWLKVKVWERKIDTFYQHHWILVQFDINHNGLWEDC